MLQNIQSIQTNAPKGAATTTTIPGTDSQAAVPVWMLPWNHSERQLYEVRLRNDGFRREKVRRANQEIRLCAERGVRPSWEPQPSRSASK
jgi:hypothetical protein